MHFKKLFDSRFIGSWDLEDKPELVVTIEEVKREEIFNTSKNGPESKPVIYFKGSKTGKGWVLNKTCAKAIADLFGPDVSAWAGKRVTLYKTTCKAFGQTADCIRVKAAKQDTEKPPY